MLGEWDFYGLTFQIDRSVLIPRSDTERLCELVIGQARQRVSPRILDLCCGSGCIGIAAAHEVEDARVAGVDISEGALRVTRENARRLGVQGRYVALKADVRFRPPNKYAGSLTSEVPNPPYVTRAEMRALEPSVADYKSRTKRCSAGRTGWIFTVRSAPSGGSCYVPGGVILFECGYRQATQVAAILEDNRFAGIGITEDLSGVPRIVYGYNTLLE